MGSGTLWVLIALLWAAVLVPTIWRKRRDMREERSVEDFRKAMGRLGRTAIPKGATMSRSSRRAALRRRNVTIALVALVLVTGLTTLLGWLPAITLALSLMLLAVWLILAARATMKLTQVSSPEVERERFAAVVTRSAKRTLEKGRQVLELHSEVDVYVNEPIEIQALTRAQSMTMHPATLGWAAVAPPTPAHLRAPAVPVGQRTPGYEKPGSWSENVLEQLEVRKTVAEQLDLDAAIDTQEIPVVVEVPIRRAASE